MERLKRVGLVATGDELVNGDILNTNGQYFTRHFIDQNIQPGRQVTVSDDTAEIQAAIEYLATDHDAIITIGGLGPTSDDKTRFGFADALGLELEFSPEAWQWIVDMLTKIRLDIPESNRQQAMFPTGANLIFNPNGTAAACHLEKDGKDYFMLPGPPNECLPLFEQEVLPLLLDKSYAQQLYRRSWLLFGVSESSVAEQLEAVIDKNRCRLGYRVSYPYLEVKLISDNQEYLDAETEKLLQEIGHAVISDQQQTASQQLINKLSNLEEKMAISDLATGGRLEKTLLAPKTAKMLSFSDNEAAIKVEVKGLKAYWQGETEPSHMPLSIKISSQQQHKNFEKQVPYRGERSLLYAVEAICSILLAQL